MSFTFKGKDCKLDIETENPQHDAWFIEFYTEGHMLRDHENYLVSLWAWHARALLEREHIEEQTLDANCEDR
jgi:hypothetical protein